MNSDRPALFCDADLAERIERVETQLVEAAVGAAHRRLADAASAGCDIGVITTQPASKSQQNAQRSGFELLYTRAVLVTHPGLC